MTQRQKIINIVTLICMSIYSGLEIYYLVRRCGKDYDNFLRLAADYGVIVMFTCLGIAFLICGIIMNLALRKYFPHFYESHRCFLWLATISLGIPLLFRAVNNLLLKTSKGYNEFEKKEFVVASNVYLILSTYVPILTSMSSLIFGYLRMRQDKMNSDSGNQKPNTHGGSGELVEYEFDDVMSLSSSAKASEKRSSFLDPPIENYRFIYSGKQQSPKISRSESASPANSKVFYFNNTRQGGKRMPDGIGGIEANKNSKKVKSAIYSPMSDSQ